MKTYKTFRQQSTALTLVYIVTTLVGLYVYPTAAVAVVTTALFLLALSWRLYRALHRQIGEQQFTEYRQIEALTALYGTLDIRQPLPQMRHTAASPDFLHLLACEIFRSKPEVIVEVGSGTSTLVAAYCLKRLGRGRLISLDHLDKYADITRQTIVDHGLSDIASVSHAPLKSYQIDNHNYQWYDDAVLEGIETIDLLVVDGPPQQINAWARYPAVPLLSERLGPHSRVLLDDGGRTDETAIIAAWRQRYGLEYTFIETEKGAFVCRAESG